VLNNRFRENHLAIAFGEVLGSDSLPTANANKLNGKSKGRYIIFGLSS